MPTNNPVTLAIYPNTRGFGYICLENPQSLIDWGMMTCRPLSNSKILKQVASMLDYFNPTLLIVQDPDNKYSRQGYRVAQLIETIQEKAEERNIKIVSYTREQIRNVFSSFGATTKHEIASKLLQWFPELMPRAPKVRKLWMKEDYNMGIFDALSLAITHAYLTE